MNFIRTYQSCATFKRHPVQPYRGPEEAMQIARRDETRPCTPAARCHDATACNGWHLSGCMYSPRACRMAELSCPVRSRCRLDRVKSASTMPAGSVLVPPAAPPAIGSVGVATHGPQRKIGATNMPVDHSCVFF